MTHNTPAVLIYRLSPLTQEGRALRSYLQQHGIRSITVGTADGGKTISALLGLPAAPAAPAGAIDLPAEPVLVLYGIMGPSFDALLDFLQKNAPVRLKAVATPFNLRWSFARLARELGRDAVGSG